MSVFTFIILILFTFTLVSQFMVSLEKNQVKGIFLHGFEILAFAYLAKVLM